MAQDREIRYIIRMQNDASAAIATLVQDLRSLQGAIPAGATSGGGAAATSNNMAAQTEAAMVRAVAAAAATWLRAVNDGAALQERTSAGIANAEARNQATMAGQQERNSAKISNDNQTTQASINEKSSRTSAQNNALAETTQYKRDNASVRVAGQNAATLIAAQGQADAKGTVAQGKKDAATIVASGRVSNESLLTQAKVNNSVILTGDKSNNNQLLTQARISAIASNAVARDAVTAQVGAARATAVGTRAAMSGGGGGGGGNFLSGIIGAGGTAGAILTGLTGGFAAAALRAIEFTLAGKLAKEALERFMEAGDMANREIGKLSVILHTTTQEASALYDRIEHSAQKAGMSTETLTSSFVRFNMALQPMGKSADEVAEFTETLSKLGAISGTDPQRMRMAFLQLSQGMSLGKLQAQDFKAMLEDMPPLALLLAKGLNITNGELRQMAHEGRLGPEAIFGSVKKGTQSVDEDFSKLPMTVARATESMETSIDQLAHKIDERFGITSTWARFIKSMSDIVQTTADHVAEPDTTTQIERVQAVIDKLTHAKEVAAAIKSDPDHFNTNTGDGLTHIQQLRDSLKFPGESKGLLADLQAELAGLKELLVAEQSLRQERDYAAGELRKKAAAENDSAQMGIHLKEITDGLGLSNSKLSAEEVTLQKVIDAGGDAFSKYKMNVEQATVIMDVLKDKISPMRGLMREFNNELKQAVADNQGEIAGAVRRRIAGLEARGEVITPEKVNETEAGVLAVAAEHGKRAVRDATEAALLAAARLAGLKANDHGWGEGILRINQDFTRNQANNPDHAQEIKEQQTATLSSQVAASAFGGQASLTNSIEQQKAKTNAAREALKAYYETGAEGAGLATIEGQAHILALAKTKNGQGEVNAVYETFLGLLKDEAKFKGNLAAEQDISKLREQLAITRIESDLVGLTAGHRERELAALSQKYRLEHTGRGQTDPALVTTAVDLSRANYDANARNKFSEQVAERARGYRDEVAGLGLVGDALETEKMLRELDTQAFRDHTTVSKENRDIALDALKYKQDARIKQQGDVLGGARAGIDGFLLESRDAFGQTEKLVKSMGDSMSTAIADFATGGKTTFRDFANTVIKEMIRIAAQQAIIGPLMKGIGMGLNLFSGGGGAAGVATSSGVTISYADALASGMQALHKGGFAGANDNFNSSRTVSSDVFAGAKRYHSGGIPGLTSGEVPIIAKRNEAIFPTVRLPDGTMGIRGAGGGASTHVFSPNTVIHITPSGNSQGGAGDHEAMGESVGRHLDAVLEQKMTEFTNRQSRPGGLFNSVRRSM